MQQSYISRTNKNQTQSRKAARKNQRLPIALFNPYQSLRVALRAENKHADVLNNNVSATSAASFYNLSSLSEGADDGERIGRMVQIQHLFFDCMTRYNTSNTDTYQFVRFIVFIDTSDELATAPVIANLLDSTSSTAQSVAPINSSYLDRYVVILDKLHVLSTYQPYQHTKRFIALPNIGVTTWNGSAANTYGKNHVWLCIIGSGTTNMHGATTYSRCTYVDN